MGHAPNVQLFSRLNIYKIDESLCEWNWISMSCWKIVSSYAIYEKWIHLWMNIHQVCELFITSAVACKLVQSVGTGAILFSRYVSNRRCKLIHFVISYIIMIEIKESFWAANGNSQKYSNNFYAHLNSRSHCPMESYNLYHFVSGVNNWYSRSIQVQSSLFLFLLSDTTFSCGVFHYSFCKCDNP